MVKKTGKRIITFVLAFAVCMPLASGLTGNAAQVQDTQAETDAEITDAVIPETGAEPLEAEQIHDGFELIAENESLELYLNKGTLGIQVRGKTDNVIYSSFAENDEGMNESWQNFMYSGVTLEYMNDKMSLVRVPLAGSGAAADIKPTGQGFEADISYKEGFSFLLRVTLSGKRLTVEVPDDSIREPEEGKKLQSLYIYPFLGASHGNQVPGYLFIPDGCGALIRTDVESVAVSGTFNKKVYGQELGVGDFSVLTEMSPLKPAERIHMPVYGIAPEEGRSAIAAIVESGDVYANIEAGVYGREVPVNYVTAKFVYRETYTRSLNKKGTTMVSNQPKRNNMDIVEHYEFLSGGEADYVGMAEVYRNYLLDKGVLAENNGVSDTIPLHLEILLSEQKKQMIGSKTIKMTTGEQADEIISRLCADGISDMSVTLFGYSPDGNGLAKPSNASFNRKIASKGEWEDFIKKWKEKDIDVGFYADFAVGNKSADGYKVRRDVAQNVSEKLLETFWYEPMYYLSPRYVERKFEKEAKEFKEIGTELLVIDTIGSQLYSDWKSSSATSREEAKEIYANLSQEGIRTGFYKASSYLWKNAEGIYDIPSASSGYTLFTEDVPFMQIVLKGYIDYYSDKSNFHADRQRDTLRMIEYGEYPSWMVTYADTLELLDTPSAWLYTSEFSIWEAQIKEEYGMLSDALGKVRNAHMAEREVLDEDVVRVIYDNGVAITVNYGEETYSGDGVAVEPLSYKVSDVK